MQPQAERLDLLTGTCGNICSGSPLRMEMKMKMKLKAALLAVTLALPAVAFAQDGQQQQPSQTAQGKSPYSFEDPKEPLKTPAGGDPTFGIVEVGVAGAAIVLCAVLCGDGDDAAASTTTTTTTTTAP